MNALLIRITNILIISSWNKTTKRMALYHGDALNDRDTIHTKNEMRNNLETNTQACFCVEIVYHIAYTCIHNSTFTASSDTAYINACSGQSTTINTTRHESVTHIHTNTHSHIHPSHASILSSYLKRFFFGSLENDAHKGENCEELWTLLICTTVATINWPSQQLEFGIFFAVDYALRVTSFTIYFFRSIKSRIASKEKQRKLINNAKRVPKWRWRSFHVGDDTLYAIYWCWRAHHIAQYCPVNWNWNFITTLHDVVVRNVIQKTVHRIHLQTELVFTCTTHTFVCRCMCVLSRCHRRARAHCAIESERNTP